MALIVPGLFVGFVALAVTELPTAEAAAIPGYPTFYVNSTGFNGAEPTIGISSSGALFIQASTNAVRSLDGGTTWAAVSPITNGVTTLDPLLQVDRVSDRVFSNQLYAACSRLAYTDNPDGATTSPIDWVQTPFACGQKPGQDHQKLASGPLPENPELENIGEYERALYYAWSDVGTADFMVARSLDGGLTWVQGNSIAQGLGDRGVIGALPSGIIYVSEQTGYVYGEYATNFGSRGVSVSKDGGFTWAPQEITLRGLGHGGNTDGGIYEDAAGNVYVAWWNDADYGVYYSFTSDDGTTWSPPTKVSLNLVEPPLGFDVDGTIRTTIFPTVTAGNEGELALMFLGTEDAQTHPDDCDLSAGAGVDCRWRAYMTRVSGANTLTPEITSYAVTEGALTIDKYVQIGSIHVGGGDDPDRNLLDFNDIDIDNDGWPIMTIADGCISAPSCTDDNGARRTTFMKAMGPGMNLAGDTPPPPGIPEVKITDPTNGASVASGSISVSGLVDRDSDGGNVDPVATLSADVTSGEKPLSVTFTLGGSDADGSVASWSFDADGDGNPEAGGAGEPSPTFAHTFTSDGSYTAALTVTDDEGATGSATVVITVEDVNSGIPQPDGSLSASIFAYNEGGLGASNVIAIATGEVAGDDVPKYVAGETVTLGSRSTVTNDPGYPINENTNVNFFIYNVDEEQVMGPIATSGSAENPTLFDCAPCFAYSSGPVEIPLLWEGRHYLVPIATVNGEERTIGIKPIDIIGAPLPSESGNDDEGHTVGDPNDDATAPTTEILWVDAAVTPTTVNIVFQLTAVGTSVGDSPFLYAAVINGFDLEAYVLGTGPSIWDNTNGQSAGGSTVWDPVTGQVSMSIPRTYLAGLGADCPCTMYFETRLGTGGTGGVQMDDRAPDAGQIQLTYGPQVGSLERVSTVIPLGSSSDPEVSDPQDNDVGFMDIRKMWVQGEDADSFELVMELEDLSTQPPSVDVGISKVAASYSAEFCLDNNLNSDPTGPLFCYRLSAVKGLPAATFSGGVVQRDDSGSCGLSNLVTGGVFNTAANTVTWRMSRAAFDVTQNSADVNGCTTDPIVRGGNALVDGSTLTALSGSTGASAGAVIIFTIGVGDATPSGEGRAYTFGAATPLTADAGGAYTGTVDTPIAITGAGAGGTPPYTCAWTGSGTFADATACATTVTFDTAGAKTITLDVTDDASATAGDTATVTVGGSAAERVDLFLDEETTPRGSASVTTDATNPTATWTTTFNAATSAGSHQLTAKWIDSDGTVLDTHTITINVGDGGTAFVTITNPTDDPAGDTPLSGTIPVTGIAGHNAGAQLNAPNPLRERTTMVSGELTTACAACVTSLATSAAWRGGPAGIADGLDGRWLNVAGRGGAPFALDAAFGGVANVWFFENANTWTPLGSVVNADAVKLGTVPPGANWAFVALAAGSTDIARLQITWQAGVPGMPSDATAVAVAHGAVVSWSPTDIASGSAITGYQVFRDGALVATVPADATSFTDAGLAAGVAVSYEVAAVNAVGASLHAVAGSATPEADTDTLAPSAATGLVVTGADASGVSLAWNAADGASLYRVIRGDAADVTLATGTLVGTVSGLAFTDASIVAGATGHYVVAALDAANNVAPVSDFVIATAGAGAGESVTLTIDGNAHATIPVDTTSGDASWSSSLDTTGLADGAHLLEATYDDGQGSSATDSVTFHIANGAEIAITDPTEGAEVQSSFTVSGVTTGTGGPGAPAMNSYLTPNGKVDPTHFALQAANSQALKDIDQALSGEAGYIGVSPMLDGSSVVVAYFEGPAPESMPNHLVPDGWQLRSEPEVVFVPALRQIDAVYDLTGAPREGPPVPAMADGLGPGSHLIMNRPDGTFGCTANWIWEDQDGNLYLGAAGHCFLPEDKTSTHGADADYDPTLTRVRVCVSECTNGGQTGFTVRGNMVVLGDVVYSRQKTGGSQLGHDFGVVLIPDEYRDLVRPHMPVWNGPEGSADVALGDLALHYGNSMAFGEVFPTMARAGIGMGSNSFRWVANTPGIFGDSGSAMSIGTVRTSEQVVEGLYAAGELTHLTVNTGVVGGNTMGRSIQMAREAGLELRAVLQGESVIGVPGAVSDLAAFAGDAEVTLTWSAPSSGGDPITSYTVDYGTSSGDHTAGTVTVSSPGATITGLTNGQTYFFVVKATNGNGDGPASNEASATPTVTTTVPGAPTSVSAAAGDSEVIVSWQPPASDGGSAVTSYTVKYGTTDGGPYGTTASVAGQQTTISGLTNGETYFFVVTATNAVGEGPASTQTSATPSGSGLPGTPRDVFAIGGDGTIDVYWNAPSSANADSYTVKFGTTSGSHPSATTTTAQSATLTGLTNGQTYFIVVSASNGNGEGPESAETTATPNAGGSFSVQVRITSGGSPVIDWTAADSYDGSSFSHSVTGLGPGSYTIEARLLRGSDVIGTDVVNVITGNRDPTVDAGVDRSADEGTLVMLAATASDPDGDALTYEWAQLAGPTVTLADDTTAAPRFTAPQVDENTVLTFEVTVSDPHSGEASDDVSITVRDLDAVSIDNVNGLPAGSPGTLRGVVPIDGSFHLAAGNQANQPPSAVISNVVLDGMTLSASGASSTDPDGSIVAYDWDLGNGASASGASLAYEYPDEGTFTLMLTVTDDRGASDQAQFGPFEVKRPVEGIVVDAGDSQAVATGDTFTLSAAAFGATGAVTYAWDTDGDAIPDASGQNVVIDSTGMAAGPTTFTAFATDSTGATASDDVQNFLYDVTVNARYFEEFVPVGVNDEDAGVGGTVDGATFDYSITVPQGSKALDAFLTWDTYADVIPDNPTGIVGGPNDFDLYVYDPDMGEAGRSADFDRPESVNLESPVGGDWTVRVVSYIVAAETVKLFVNVTEAPLIPLPYADQASNVCQASPTQTLTAVAQGAGVTGAWDLDFDGVFETDGFTATTTFLQDGSAHLVRFRATTTDGYRDTILMAVRASVDCASPGVVTVAVADTGINPYSREWAGEHVPYPDLVDFTTAESLAPAAKDVLKYHEQTGELLPFTRHPSYYIPGFPADAEALDLTLGGGFYKNADNAAVWDVGHDTIKMNKWYWIPGTKIVAAMDTSDVAAVNAADDVTPLYDDDGHGQASASVAVGNYYGTCPRCVLVFFEGLGGDNEAFDQSWIDFVSVSGGSLGNVGTPDGGNLDIEGASRAAAERGQTLSYAAGNGNENAFVTPQQTYTSNSLGPDWTINVGAVSKSSRSSVLGSGKPVDWSSYGSGSIQSGCRNNYQGACGHSGTSAATPIATGVMADILLNARISLGDEAAGQKSSTDAAGQLQAVAVGAPSLISPFLSDGVFTRAELWNVAFHCASQIGTGIGFPGNGPRSDVDYAYAGYGIADTNAAMCGADVLLNGAALPVDVDADEFFEVDEDIRDHLWGDWDGNGDGALGGNFNNLAPIDTPVPPTLTFKDVDTVDEVSKLIADMYEAIGTLGASPVVTETYYLHRTGCGSGGDAVFMDRTPALTEETGHGCGGAAANMDKSWASVVPTASGFGPGSTVQAAVRAFTLAPHPALTVTGTLFLNGNPIGSASDTQESISIALVDTPCTEWQITFQTTAAVPAGSLLTFAATTEPGSGDVPMCYEGGTTASRMAITGSDGTEGNVATITSPTTGADFDPATTPTVTVSGTAVFGAGGSEEVQVSVNDVTFSSGLLTVTGTDSWSADWDVSGLADGSYTLYARATAGGVNGAATSVGVTLTTQEQERVPSVEVAYMRVGQAPGAGDWEAATLDEATDTWSTSWDTDAQGNGRYDVHARLLGDGVETARDMVSVTVANNKAPFMTPVGPQQSNENELMSFTVTATDDNGDALTYSMDPTLPGASLDSATGAFSWTPTFEQAGSYDVTFTATDGEFEASDTATLTVVDVNRAPSLVTGGDRLIDQGSTLSITLTGSDPDGDALTFGADPIPAGASFDAASATLTWTPSGADIGDHAATFTVSDGDLGASETISIRVVDTNDPPVLLPVGDKTTAEDANLAIALGATDPENDVLTFSMTGAPTGASLDPATGAFSWTPDFDQAGTYDVTFSVTDGQYTASETITITVTNVNRAPTLAQPTPVTALEGTAISVPITIADPDGDRLAVTATGMPAGATLGGDPWTVSWTPQFDQSGNYDIELTVSDGDLTDTKTLMLQIGNANRAPVVSVGGPAFAAAGASVAFSSTATDPDGDTLTFAWDFGDGGTSTDASPTHAFAAAGAYTVSLTVTDSGGETASAAKDIAIDGTAPVTTATVTGPSTPDGWFDESARVVLAATDDASGVKSTKHALNANTLFQQYAAPIALPAGEGTHTVKFRSTDEVGNVETTQSVTLKVDTVAPSVAIAGQRPLAVLLGGTVVKASATDAGSGVARVDFVIDGTVICSDTDGSDGYSCAMPTAMDASGAKTLVAEAYDALGHMGSDSAQVLIIGDAASAASAPEDPSVNGVACDAAPNTCAAAGLDTLPPLSACFSTYDGGRAWTVAFDDVFTVAEDGAWTHAPAGTPTAVAAVLGTAGAAATDNGVDVDPGMKQDVGCHALIA